MSVADKVRALVERVAERQSVLPDPKRAKRVFPLLPPPLVLDPFEVKPVLIKETGYSQALAGIVDTEFIKTVRYGEQQYRADALGAHPIIIEFSTLLVRRMRALGVPMFPHSIWRGEAEQNAAYRRGTSDAQYPESPHNRGCAVDVIHSRKAWDLTARQWLLIGHVGKEIAASKGWKLVWGGDWRKKPTDEIGWDPAHWELASWRSHAMARLPPPVRATR
ncbi:M15 family metallopeptidase [Aminobacter aganoensis]|uniref:Peptidase M15C domain-containing protein n=1 Tax=Aminobacter aganoensis TaxID=83264 RepID=A0A7X0KMP9_9HYPH|nr:M15 family metallopeptidase [Aminobacter aganoensis]MBB6356279.1 hypothetical protein [Aminobacter aganoensis]